MAWIYAVIAALCIIGVLLAFPLAVAILVVLAFLVNAPDWFTKYFPGFKQLRRHLWKKKYRAGTVISQFIARDIRRDVEVVDASQIDGGIIQARIRTWNVLYATNGLAPIPDFGDVETVEIRGLWEWSGAPWGGPVPGQTDPLAEFRTERDLGNSA